MKKVVSRKNILKETVVLCIMVLIVLSVVSVTANISDDAQLIDCKNKTENTPYNGWGWDNGMDFDVPVLERTGRHNLSCSNSHL